MSIADLKQEMRSLALKGQEIVTSDDGRTPAEKREALDKIEADIKTLSERINDEQHLLDQRAKFAGIVGDTQPKSVDEPRGPMSIGEQFVASDGFKTLPKGREAKGRFTTGSVEVKATITQTASPITRSDRQAGITLINLERPAVADLMPNLNTDSNAVSYLKETTATNAAAAVAEEGLKPESTLILAEVVDPVRKIATTIKVTDEMLDDEPAVRGYIDNRLGMFVALEEDDQLLNGSGVAPNVTGLRNRTGLQADVAVGVSPDTGIEAIYRQITAIRANAFIEPTGLVVHPNDWSQIRLAKDGNQNYYGGGPFGQQAGDVLWGLPVVITTQITEGTALVGAFATAAAVFRRGGLTIEATNSNEDDFKYNRVAIRAEQRVALAVFRPGAFGEVTGL